MGVEPPQLLPSGAGHSALFRRLLLTGLAILYADAL
jgi:hypothetical protein